jgi:hypothetical protein
LIKDDEIFDFDDDQVDQNISLPEEQTKRNNTNAEITSKDALTKGN